MITGVLIPVIFVCATLALRKDRKGPVPSWADVAAIAVVFDIAALASAKDWAMMFQNAQVQEFAGEILASLLGAAFLVWVLLLVLVESANERNFDFESNQYVSRGKRFMHWFAGTFPVVLLFAAHLTPFLWPVAK